jgi:glycosyltransferase involved in cell wall biosynthesis
MQFHSSRASTTTLRGSLSGSAGRSAKPARLNEEGDAHGQSHVRMHDVNPAAIRNHGHALRVAMLNYSFYESDGRVRRYAETLARRGDNVDVFSLRNDKQKSRDNLKGVNVYRIQMRVRDEKGKFAYLLRIMKFFVRSAALLTFNHLKHPYDIIHVHSVPDFEVFAAIIPKLLGAKVILDIHDIVPELYANKFNVSRNSLTFKLLVLTEKISTKFADHVIISNDFWKETLIRRSSCNGKCTAIMNYPDNNLFFREPEKRTNDTIVFLYPGTLNYHQGLDLAVKAFNKIKDKIPNSEFHIYGEGPAQQDLAEMIVRYGIEGRVILKDSVPLDEIATIMADADVGVIPKRNDSFGGEAFSTKTLEFMSLSVPIIVSRTKIDQHYFNDSVVKFFEAGNVDDLAESMMAMGSDKSFREDQAARALEFVAQYNWRYKKHLYLDIVKNLTGKQTR